ncbi:MBF1B [Symbiodinium sp. CCMP2592]|nr:MBF1B [Symbiodinium sp. CCMP2592]
MVAFAAEARHNQIIGELGAEHQEQLCAMYNSGLAEVTKLRNELGNANIALSIQRSEMGQGEARFQQTETARELAVLEANRQAEAARRALEEANSNARRLREVETSARQNDAMRSHEVADMSSRMDELMRQLHAQRQQTEVLIQQNNALSSRVRDFEARDAALRIQEGIPQGPPPGIPVHPISTPKHGGDTPTEQATDAGRRTPPDGSSPGGGGGGGPDGNGPSGGDDDHDRRSRKSKKDKKHKKKKSRRRMKATENDDSVEDEVGRDYIIIGAWIFSGMTGVTNSVDRHAQLTKYLIAFMKSRGLKDTFTSICINHGGNRRVHRDLLNHDNSLNHTLGVGSYQGGSVWVEQKDDFPVFRREGVAGGKSKCVKVTGGLEVDGRVYDTHDRMLSFHPKLWHQAQPWTGDRWTITAYTIRDVDGLSWEQSKSLMSLGFQLNSSRRLPFVPSLITGDSDEELTLYDFAKKKKAEAEKDKEHFNEAGELKSAEDQPPPPPDYTEYFPDEGVIVRHHMQPRKAKYAVSAAEADVLNIGDLRLTERQLLGSTSAEEQWDDGFRGGKASGLWTGTTYLFDRGIDKHHAVAAVKRIRDKNTAKKEARKQAFYDISQLSSGTGCMKQPVNIIEYDMKSFLEQAVQKYKDLPGPKYHTLKSASTPFADEKIARPIDDEAEAKGWLVMIFCGLFRDWQAGPASPIVVPDNLEKRIEPESNGVLIEWGHDPSFSLLGRADDNGSGSSSVVRVTHSMDLNSTQTSRDLLKVVKGYAKSNVPITVWVDLRFAGGPDDRKRFGKLWSSFVNLSTGLDLINCRYIVIAPWDHFSWKMDRVIKWCSNHECTSFEILDDERSGNLGHWRLHTSHKNLPIEVMNNFHGCKLKNIFEPRFPARQAAVAVQVTLSEDPIGSAAVMASPMPTVSLEERRRRIEAFRRALKDPECLAEAMAFEEPAYFKDAYGVVKEAYQYKLVEPAESDPPEAIFLGRIKNGEWIGLRKQYPYAGFPLLYEMWHSHFNSPAHQGMPVEGFELLGDSLLTEWTELVKSYLRDLAYVGHATNAEMALKATEPFDVCHRAYVLSQETLGYHELMPAATALLDSVYTPALRRIEHQEQPSSYFIVGGDSSLALVTRDGGRVQKKGTMEPSLREEMTKDIRMDGCSVIMRWGKGLGDIVWNVEQELNRVQRWRNGQEPLTPEGVDIIIQWGGNDVYGEYGYKGFSFHMRNAWVRVDDALHDTLSNWETKARKAVEDAKDALVRLSSRKGVSSVTLAAGPHNGEFYGLPEVYDLEMARHSDEVKERGIRIVDPQALILATERYDGFHMEATHDNVKVTTNWFFHLCSAIMFERWLVKHAMGLKANSRGILFHNHFHLGLGLEELDIPPTTDLLIPAEAEMVTFPPEAPPVQRFPEEEIVLNQPILSLEKLDELEGVPPTDYVNEVAKESEEITVEDVVSRNPNPEDEHLTVEAVDPGSEMEQIVRNMIESVNLVMSNKEAEEVAQETGVAPYEYVEPNVTATFVVDGEAVSTIATSDIPTEVWDSGPMAVDYGADDEVEHPRGSGGPIWLTPDQLPDVRGRMGYFRLTEMECVSLGKKLSWHLRGHAKDKGFRTVEFDEEQAAEIGDVLKVIGKQWSRLTVMTIIDLLTSDHCDKGRFELQAEALGEDTRVGRGTNWHFTRIRAFQGHNACLLVLGSDPLKNTVKQWALDDKWIPCYVDLPITGPYPYRATAFDLMPKLAYHATYWRNFTKIVNTGLIPGGKMTSKGNSGRPFNMFAMEPQWERTSNQGVRPGAQLEFVIDLQLAACDGCRFFETKAGALQTPDWISNRAILYAYDRSTQEMIWANRAYEPARKRLAQACKDKSLNTPIYGERGHQELVDANGYCYNYLVAGLGYRNFDTWKDAAKACKDVYDLDFYPTSMCGLDIRIPEGHALQGSESLYKMVVHVAPKHPHQRCNDESDWRRQENVSIPSFGCPSCDVSMALENTRAKQVAARKGEPLDYRALQPSGEVNSNRATGNKRDRSAGSGPAAVRQQAAKYLGKALMAGSRTVVVRQSRDPFTAYNNARFGISITGLEQLMIFARMRIANPPRSRQMIHDRTGFDGAAKVSFSFPPEGEDLTLTDHCFVAFVDRFHKLDEAALLAFAVHRNGYVMDILGFSGRILKPTGPVVQILARIVGFFQDEVRYAVERGERVPELVLPANQELRVPEGLASLGDRQLNELLINTKFARQLPGAKGVNERVGYAFRAGRTETRGRSAQPPIPKARPTTRATGSAQRAGSVPPKPRARPRDPSPGVAATRMRPTEPSYPPPGRDVPGSSTDAPMRPPEPKGHDALLWARLKASRDKNVPRGMEDRAVPAFHDLNDFHLLAPEHVGYFLSGWKVWQKSAPKGKSAKSATEVNAARRTGGYVETDKKFGGGTNVSAHSTVPNAKKLDENGETFRHATVSHEFKTALQQARIAKKMTQTALATAINEKGSVINEYESGKAIPNGAIINKLNKALGVRLPKAK